MVGQGNEVLDPERQTHGSDQRTARPLSVPLASFDIAAIAEQLRGEPAFASDGRNAKTIHDDGSARVLVSVLEAQRELGAQQSDGYVTLTMHAGRGSLRRGDESTELHAGCAAILAPGAAWDLTASEPSVLMATFWAFGEHAGSYSTPTSV